ncbi:MAG TPA: hypothetical protein PK728_00875 [Bacillota bacterium]|nr:hypothetical protein [Bacillota bacterium]
MPRCNNCGNTRSLASTLVPPAAPAANAPPYGLVANFDENGALATVECQGADLGDAEEAFAEPARFFDVCPLCGSNNIEW